MSEPRWRKMIWLGTYLRGRDCPVCWEVVRGERTDCPKCGYDFAAAADVTRRVTATAGSSTS